jgi:hypothetical protein
MSTTSVRYGEAVRMSARISVRSARDVTLESVALKPDMGSRSNTSEVRRPDTIAKAHVNTAEFPEQVRWRVS